MTRDQLDRLTEVLESWKGTPYLAGHAIKGQGADCIQFVNGVLNELYGRDVVLPRLPATAAYHSESAANPVLKALMKGFPYDRVDEVEPGDIIVSQSAAVRTLPHHVLIASANPLVYFHCFDGVGVCSTPGVTWITHCIFRTREKHLWVR